MILYPAIDIRGGRAVRLVRGDFDREIAYDADPVDAARRWSGQGARFLHVVDLDGAREGRPLNLEHVRRIAEAVDVPLQLGGGLRAAEDVEQAFGAGAERVVLGTKAQQDPELISELVSRHGGRIVASVDARGARVSVSGWTEETGIDPVELVGALGELGVSRIVFTPVDVDGTLAGPALDALRRVAGETGAELIYSGGIGSLDDLCALAALRLPNLGGAIVGRALYEGRFEVAQGQAALEG